jgi:hypothetical protein
MHKRPLITVRLFLSLLILCACFGCASGGTRLYPEALRPPDQVAVILSADRATFVRGIGAREGREEKMLYTGVSFEVLPGRYSFFVAYLTDGYNTTTVGKGVNLDVDLKPGHAYVLYGKLNDRGKKWYPVFVDITDYHQEDCGGGCSDRKELNDLKDEHFRGERRAVTKRSWGGWQ